MESIVFRWHNQADIDEAVEWIALDADGKPHISIKTGSLNDLARQLNSQTHKKQAVFLLSANYYSLYEVKLPPKLSLNNIKKAAPYAIEDELVDGIDEYHFAYGDIKKEDDATVAYMAAISKHTFAQLMDNLAEHHIIPKYVYPENLLLPASSSTTDIFIDNNNLHTRLENGLAHTLPVDLLTSVIDDVSDERSIRIISQAELYEPKPEIEGKDISYEVSDKSLLGIFARQLNEHKPFNFLQGEFKHQEEFGKYLKPWRWPLALTAVALLLTLITQLFTVNQLEKQNLDLQDQKIAIYKQAFPRSKNINVYSVRTRMEQAVKRAGGGTVKNSQFIPLLEQYTKVLDQENNIDIDSIDYSKEKLSLTLIAKDIQMLDQIKVKLEKNQRIVANILSSKTVTDGIEATLKLELR